MVIHRKYMSFRQILSAICFKRKRLAPFNISEKSKQLNELQKKYIYNFEICNIFQIIVKYIQDMYM